MFWTWPKLRPRHVISEFSSTWLNTLENPMRIACLKAAKALTSPSLFQALEIRSFLTLEI